MDLRKDFIQLKNNNIYLDSAATTLKPKCVIESLNNFYSNNVSNIGRALYKSSIKATDMYELSRENIAKFIGASYEEIIFTSGATDGINMVANNFSNLTPDDEIIISEMEHHSNIIPWIELSKKTGCILKIIKTDNGKLDLNDLKDKITTNTKIVSLIHMSNVNGSINDIKEISNIVKKYDSKLLIDCAQSVVHIDINLNLYDIDFIVFSGHKLYAPTGIGILYINKKNINNFKPFRYGGGTVSKVNFNNIEYYNDFRKFEAGTPPIAEAIALGEAIKYLKTINLSKIYTYEQTLLNYLIEGLASINDINILSFSKNNGPIITFTVNSINSFDIATFLDLKNISIRSGHLCAQPFLNKLGAEQALRVSIALYNNKNDINIFIDSLKNIINKLKIFNT